MSLSITCTENKRGPAVNVVFLAKCNGHGLFEEYAGPISIGSAAIIWFKFSWMNHSPKPISKFTVMTSVLKYFKNKTINVSFNCKQLKFSKQLCAITYKRPIFRRDLLQSVDWQQIGAIELATTEYRLELTMIKSTVEIISFSKLYDDTELTDFLLRSADSGTVAVHKACLAAHSDVFKKMLLSNFKETTEGCIEFKDVTLETLEYLKNYMYLGILPDKGRKVAPLLLIAKCYMMTNLLEAAVNKICQTATAANLYSLLQLATENNIPELALGLVQMANNEAVNKIVIKKQKLQPIGEPSKKTNKKRKHV